MITANLQKNTEEGDKYHSWLFIHNKGADVC